MTDHDTGDTSVTFVVDHPWWFFFISAWPGDAAFVGLRERGGGLPLICVSREQWEAENRKQWRRK